MVKGIKNLHAQSFLNLSLNSPYEVSVANSMKIAEATISAKESKRRKVLKP
jgi:hypothetical protein